MVDNRVVIGIKEDTFKACDNIVSITIPSTVTTIGKDAFMGCSSLSKITIPNSITSIADGALTAVAIYPKLFCLTALPK